MTQTLKRGPPGLLTFVILFIATWKQNTVNNARSEHIYIRDHLIRDWVSKGGIELFHVPSGAIREYSLQPPPRGMDH
eukprot:7833395-Pyramimonas_sp.AAC.1